jgi:glycosyltransferase involved in cell wall biosynthesis
LYGHNIEKNSYLDVTDCVEETYLFPFDLINKVSFTLPFLKSIINLIIDLLNILKIDNVSKTMAREIDKNNYDFVFVHHNKDYVQSPFILKYIKTKSFYFCAEPFRKFYEKGIFNEKQNNSSNRSILGIYTTLTNIIDKPCENYINKKIKAYDHENIINCDFVLTNSFFSRENILAAYGVNAKVIHLGGDTFIAQTKISSIERGNAVISVGAINGLKGYEFIVQALGTINEDERPMLIIVGNATSKVYLSKIQALANKLNVSLSIHENISDEDLSLLIQKSTLFVYAPFLEPLGLSPLEAMSFGLPVVAVKEGGLRETIVHGKNGYLVNRDPIQFGEKIVSILKDQFLREKLSIGAKESIQSYWNWDLAYKRLNSVIRMGN